LISDGTATVIASLPTGECDYDQFSNSLPLQNVIPNDGRLLEVEDIVDLSFLHEVAILYTTNLATVKAYPTHELVLSLLLLILTSG